MIDTSSFRGETLVASVHEQDVNIMTKRRNDLLTFQCNDMTKVNEKKFQTKIMDLQIL